MLDKHFEHFQQLIQTATELHATNISNNQVYPLEEVYEVKLYEGDDALSNIYKKFELSFEERAILLLSLVPYMAPQLLDIFLAKDPHFDIICTQFGGATQPPHRGVIPTGETAIFLLGGRDIEKRKIVSRLLLPDSKLAKSLLMEVELVASELPVFAGKLIPNDELIQQLLYGKVLLPQLSNKFPAQALETSHEWKDLIVPAGTRSQLQDLENWLKYHEQLKAHSELGKRTKKGYRSLFYGPPGTGKTLTASLLGKSAKRPVFRIDLSLMVSKYVGETEKNLANIFKKAEHKDWILFFDEADALFGKRTETESANDRFANQAVAFLLQRIENYNGMVILASNLKQNMDSAFMRRFQSMVYFPKPRKEERKLIWERTVPKDLPLSKEVNFQNLIEGYEITASQINNIVQSCFIDALAKQEKAISKTNLLKNMRLEFKKEDLLFENRL